MAQAIFMVAPLFTASPQDHHRSAASFEMPCFSQWAGYWRPSLHEERLRSGTAVRARSKLPSPLGPASLAAVLPHIIGVSERTGGLHYLALSPTDLHSLSGGSRKRSGSQNNALVSSLTR